MKNMKKILLFLALITFFIFPASAVDTTKVYTQNEQNAVTADPFSSTPKTFFAFDIADYTALKSVSLHMSNSHGVTTVSASPSTDSTTFTITAGGTGGGTFTYQQIGTNDYFFNWTFTSSSFTSNNVTIQYAKSITGQVTSTRGNTCDSTTCLTQPTVNAPVYFVSPLSGFPGFYTTLPGQYTVTVSDTAFIPTVITSWSNSKTNNNTLTFTVNNAEPVTFSATADRNVDRWEWYFDGVNQNNNFSAFTQSNFLVGSHNVSVSAFNVTNLTSSPITWIVNSSIGALVPGNGGSPSGQIYFDYALMNIGNNYGINTSISDANFSAFNTYFIETHEPGGAIVGGFPIEFNTQTRSTGRLWTFNKVGTYYSNLSYCSFINLLCPSVIAPTLIDTATATILPVSYTYNVTTDKPNYAKANQNITITATNPSLQSVYLTAVGIFTDESGVIMPDIAWNVRVPANSVKVFNASITEETPLGTYYINMMTSPSFTGLVARAVFNITMPDPASNTLSISWQEPFPALGEASMLSYTSNNNPSTVTVFNTNPSQAMTEVRSFAIPGSTAGNTSVTFTTPGFWYARIQNNAFPENIAWSNVSVFAGNPTDENIQRTCTSTENYACWDKKQYQQGQAYAINYKFKFPAMTTYVPVLNIIDPDGKISKSVQLNDSTFFNTTVTGSLSGTFSKSAKTGVWFVKIERHNTVDGTNGGEIAGSATEVLGLNTSTSAGIPSGATANSHMQNNLNTFMATAAFWGVLIFAFVMIAGASYGVPGTNLGMIGFILANIEAVAGLWAPYTWYVLIIIWIAAGIFYTVGSKTSGVD